MEDLHLFSNGIFSNVYKGLLKQPQRRLIAVKKSWSDQSELIFRGANLLKLYLVDTTNTHLTASVN